MGDEGKERVGDGMELIRDVAFNSVQDGGESGFGEVIAEQEEAIDNGSISTHDLMMDRTFMSVFRDCALGHTHFPEDLTQFSQASLQNFVDKHVKNGSNLVVSAVGGGIEHSEVVRQASRTFGDVPELGRPGIDYKPYFLGSMLNYRNDEMGKSVYMTMNWQTVGWRSSDALTFMLIAQMLGEYTKFDPQKLLPGVLSANRFVNACSNRGNGFGCIDYHHAQNVFFRDTGVLSVYSICDEIALQDCRSEIQFAVNMMSGGVQDEEVEKAKRELKLKLFTSTQANGGGGGSSFERVNTLGQHLLNYGRYVSPEEMAIRLDDLSAADVKRCAWEYLHDSEIAVVCLGPTHGMMIYEQIRSDNAPKRFD